MKNFHLEENIGLVMSEHARREAYDDSWANETWDDTTSDDTIYPDAEIYEDLPANEGRMLSRAEREYWSKQFDCL